MGDFYVTLQSDSSSAHFPENKGSNFRNHFGEPIRLENDKYEVALAECSYVYSSTLIEQKGWIWGVINNKTGTVRTKHFEAGPEIRTIDELVNLLFEDDAYVRVSGKRAELFVTNKDIIVSFNPKITDILGFDEESQSFVHDIFERIGNTQLYVYCNVIENQRVGNEMVPMLRKMANTGLHDEISTRTFAQLQYIDVAFSDIDHIWMYLKNESGETPLSVKGSFSATLHFRRKRY
jgi:hypothetical protein